MFHTLKYLSVLAFLLAIAGWPAFGRESESVTLSDKQFLVTSDFTGLCRTMHAVNIGNDVALIIWTEEDVVKKKDQEIYSGWVNLKLVGQIIDSDGRKLSPKVVLSKESGGFKHICGAIAILQENRIDVIWYEKDQLSNESSTNCTSIDHKGNIINNGNCSDAALQLRAPMDFLVYRKLFQLSSNNFIAVFGREAPGGLSLFAKKYNNQFEEIGEFQVNTYTLGTHGAEPLVPGCCTGIGSDGANGIVIVWESWRPDLSEPRNRLGKRFGLVGQLFDGDANKIGPEFIIYRGDMLMSMPVVVSNSENRLLFIWTANGKILGRAAEVVARH